MSIMLKLACGSKMFPFLPPGPIVQLGFARISAHPLLGYSLKPEQAFIILRQFLTDPRHRFIPDDVSCEDRIVQTEMMVGANQVTDHYLVALARQHGFSLATFDKPLAESFAHEKRLIDLLG